MLQFHSQIKYNISVIFLSYNLNDNADIVKVLKDMNRKANSILCLFNFADPFCKCFLIQSYCLALYGCQLWSLSSKNISLLEVALNKILRKVWKLPSHSHTSIVHCVSRIPSISDIVFQRFFSFFNRNVVSSYSIISQILTQSSL